MLGPTLKWKIPLPLENTLAACLKALFTKASILQAKLPEYSIISLSPVDGCPGALVEILGANFGSSGVVLVPDGTLATPPMTFSSGGGHSGRDVAPATWSDTTVSFVVPDWAMPGSIALRVNDGTVTACGRTLAVSRLGNEVIFDGGIPQILSLTVDGLETDLVVPPKSTVKVSWVASPSPTTKLRVSVTGPNFYFSKAQIASSSGSLDVTLPDIAAPGQYSVAATPTGACGRGAVRHVKFWATVIPKLKVEGIQVTQGVQRPMGWGPSAADLPLIEGKDTWVRVFVSADRHGVFGDRAVVTGRINFGSAISNLPPLNRVGKLANPMVEVGPGKPDSTRTNATLNFRLPAAVCSGKQVLKADVFLAQAEANVVPRASMIIDPSWESWNAIRLRYVRIRDDRGSVFSATEVGDVVAAQTALRAVDLLPTPPTDIGPAFAPIMGTSLDPSDGSADDGKEIARDLDDVHNCVWHEWLGLGDPCPDDNDEIWLGVLPYLGSGGVKPGVITTENTCIAAPLDVVGGAALRSTPEDKWGWDAFQNVNYSRVVAAHEIGHVLGLDHVRMGCGNDFPDGSYDDWIVPQTGELDVTPFDPWLEATLRWPAKKFYDYMSYACLRYTSARRWKQLRGSI